MIEREEGKHEASGLMLTIIILFAFSNPVSACPAECECDRAPNDNLTIIGAYCGKGGIDDNKLSALLHGFPTTLRSLEISSPHWKVQNNFRWNDNLNRFSALRHLRLINCGIPSLSRTARLPSLEHLDISRNRLQHTTMANFAGFPNLKVLDLSHNRLSSLPTGVFTYLKRLETLMLTNNSISEASSNLLRGLPSLKSLVLDHNRIPVRQLNEVLSDVPDLEELSLASCSLHPFHNLSLDRLPRLRSLDVGGNNLKSVPSTELSMLPLLNSLSLARNRIEAIPACAFCASNLTRLDLSHNKLGLRQKPFDERGFEGTSLVEISLGFNHLEDFDSDWLGPAQKSVQSLSLSGNSVRVFHARLTHDMPRLQRLQLAHNMINEIPMLLPPEYYHLKFLNLSSNLLSHLPDNIQLLLPSLETLDISGNRFSSLYSTGVAFIDCLEEVYLAGNPWDCSCALQHIQRHMKERYALRRELDYANARCAQPSLLKGQSLLTAQGVNDCAILFGARYGLSQSSELLVLLAALLTAAAILFLLLLLLYYKRERQYKGSYVTRECSRTPLTMGVMLNSSTAPLSCSTTTSTSEGPTPSPPHDRILSTEIKSQKSGLLAPLPCPSPPLPPPPPKTMSALYFGI